MWNTLSYEEKMSESLIRDFGKEKGDVYYSQYTSARNSLLKDNFFSEIKSVEPNLTDHSERHIANVIDNIYKLLGEEINNVSGINLYCLGLIALFHDVGNIEGRDNHNEKIADVYNHVRKKEPRFNRERAMIIRAGRAHCGKAKDGTRDTLKELEECDHIDGEKVDLRNLAAILRFADELAEGPQRTSNFMTERHKYDEKSMIFHKYAEITNIFIDREGGRVSITYEIELDKDSITKEETIKLLDFTIKRVLKLDEERRYNKHYCNLLMPFKTTSVKYNFNLDGIPMDLDFEKIEITDRYPIPGEKKDGLKGFVSDYNEMDSEQIWEKINEKINEE